MVNYSLVWVNWLDHCGYIEARWRFTGHVKSDLKPFQVFTVGYLLKEEEDYIVVASTISQEENDEKSQHEFCILKSCIVERVDLAKIYSNG